MQKTVVKAVCFCMAAALNCFAESAYTYSNAKDLAIGSVSVGLAVSSFFIKNSANNASKDAVLQKGNVNAFDRNLMHEYNRPLDTAGDIALYGMFFMPALPLAGNLKNSDAWATYGIMYAQSILLVFGTTEIIKNGFLRYRPYSYSEIPNGKEKEYYKSFPSRHTAFAFMSAGFLTSAFFAEHPNSSWKIPLCAASYSLAAGVGASRIFSGSHFLSDVLAGAAIGSIYGYLIPQLHLRKNSSNIAFAPLPSGLTIAFAF